MNRRDSKHEVASPPAEGRPTLPREIEPQGDLWAGIARRIDPAGADRKSASADADRRGLAREIEPARDLWPGVRRRLQETEPSRADLAPSRASWVGWAGWAVAAAALVLAFQLPDPSDETRTLDDRLATIPADVELPIEQARTGRLEARTRLLRVLAEDSSISPETRAIVERNLQTIDAALAEIQEALAADPGNASLYRLLHATYRQEAEIVAQMTRRGAGGSAL